MSSITIPAVTVADTGTGPVLDGYRMAGDTALYRENGASGAPATLLLKRTEPKPTKNYAGAGRGEAKYTRQLADANGQLWPLVFDVNVSIPAFLSDAQKHAFVDEAVRAVSLDTVRTALAVLAVPQA